MALNMARKMKKAQSSPQRGMSLIELMIAILVLTVGVGGCAVVIPIAIGRNYANRQQGNSTVMAQMVLEKIMSVPAATTTTLTITDCAGNAHNVNTAGSAGAGSGSSLLASGAVDFSQSQVADYSMNYTTCGTNGRQASYDVRWNIQTPSNFVKLITVSAKLKNSTGNAAMFSLPVTITSMIGQGS
jgi:prepilin-type N-terminal cleavage/methylation domain-containing protein